jgi:hypothetical protein
MNGSVDRDHDEWVAAIVQAIQTGTMLDLAPGETADPQQAENWPTSRRLPGEALRAALLWSDVTPDPRGLHIRAAQITGEVDFTGLHVGHSLQFEYCALEQPLDWSRITISGILGLYQCVTPSLTLDNAEIKGGAFLGNMTATGEVRAIGATIGGELNLSDANLTNQGGTALNLDGTEIKGGAYFTNLTATGEVRAVDATIGRQLNLRDANLTNQGGTALNLDGTEIKGSAYFTNLTGTGEVRAVGATIARELHLRNANLTNQGGTALNLESAQTGNAFLRNLTATGEVWAVGAIIGGSLILDDASLMNEDGKALTLSDAQMLNGFLSNVTAIGGVDAVGATIGGQLHLDGAQLTNQDGTALNIGSAQIKGIAFLSDLAATGEVWAGATSARELQLDDAKLSNESGTALSLDSARLGLVLLTPASVKGAVRLTGAQIDLLVVPEKMDVLTANDLDASGWRLGDVRGAIRHNRRAAAEWLTGKGSQKGSEFVAQPWHELASVYDRNGQPADARWVRWTAARGVTRTSPPGPKLIRWIYGALTGHGYYPLVAAFWLIIAVLVSITIVANHRDDFAPTATNRAAWKPDVPAGQSAQPITGAAPCDQLKDTSTCLNPVLWSFDNVLPGTLATGQAALWTPNAAQGWNQWVPYTLGALKLFSWILVALLLAGVTGLLRKT